MNIYVEWEKKWQQITYLITPTNDNNYKLQSDDNTYVPQNPEKYYNF